MNNDVRVQLETATMRAVAKTLENQISILRNCYGSISDDASSLKGAHWEGFSADTYYESMKALCNEGQISGKVTAGHVANILQGYVSDLNFAADEYDRNEGKTGDRVEALPAAVFDV